MTTKTYEVTGIGNFGPAHPLYNPAVTVSYYHDGVFVRSEQHSSGRVGHKVALDSGYDLPDGHRQKGTDYHEGLKAEVRGE